MLHGERKSPFYVAHCQANSRVKSAASAATNLATLPRTANPQLAVSISFAILILLLSVSIPAFGSTRRFTLTPTKVSFGTVSLNTLSSQTITITSTGTGPIVIKSVSAAGQGFSTTGGPFPVTLNPGKSMSIQATFDPTVSGVATGTLTIATNSVA